MLEFFLAGYRLLVDDEIRNFCLESSLLPFIKPQPYTHSFMLHIGAEKELPQKYSEAICKPSVCDLQGYQIHPIKDGWAFVMGARKNVSEMVLTCDAEYGESVLFASYNLSNSSLSFTSPILTAMIRCCVETGMILREGLPLHASLVDYEGDGILFLGPSGMGKSTQAKLWQDTFGAEIVIGDRPVLRKKDNVWYGFGMPWDGKDRIYKQKSVPIRACIALSKAQENRIKKLSRKEAMAVMLNQALLPMWDDNAMSPVCFLMEKVASEIDFYQLDCLPNSDAVDLSKKFVFGE